MVTGNWGGPNGGGVESPDGHYKAFISVAVSDRSGTGESSPHLIRIWIADKTTHAVIRDRRITVQSYYARWNVVWRNDVTAEFEIFDYGPSVVDAQGLKHAAPTQKRVLAAHSLKLR